MPRREVQSILAVTLACVTLTGALLSACQPSTAIALPTLAETLPAPTASRAAATPQLPAAKPTESQVATPLSTPTVISEPVPEAVTTPPPTPSHTPSATPSQTPVPTWTSTPLPKGAPVLIAVTPVLSDTTAVPTPVSRVAVAPGSINIVVLGSDQRPDWNDWHTDVVQIVSIQPLIPAVTILSVPRDLYIYVPGFWMSRINFADMYGEVYDYEGGGPALIQQTLLYNLGIPVDYYVRTDFAGFKAIVDTLGGIDIPVHCTLQDYWPYPDENGEYQIKVLYPGIHHMDGPTALWYARSRKTTSVFNREERQQQVLEGIWARARSLDLLPRIPELWTQSQSMITTNMDMATVLQLAEVAFRLESQNVRLRNIGYGQVTPWTTPHGGSVFLPNWDRIEPVVSEALAPIPEGRMWRSLHQVEIWNGTGYADWDYLAFDRLVHEGFVASVAEADRSDYTETRLIDFTTATKGSATDYLAAMFNVSPGNVIHAADPNMPVQYRIIIGADYNTCRR